ncbi:hypothetical protein PYCCODRAFT_1481613 [Trametes coccinea BRFM310]|uniref:YDG domain-containing protein n=1 Tax=Trametes coccinea (strain BRFM310) TaxID=1353009 RepID=A0A1Y2I9A2_TRAC3|nr:hypothetical protein PYCCODRAFT_1481613 [Trametes coccinea BRFM310]
MSDEELAYIFAPFDPQVLDWGEPDEDWDPQVEHCDPSLSNEHIQAPPSAFRFGHPDGVKVGDKFDDRRALFRAGVHAVLRAGIHGQQDRGAFSIVMSGGYEDDQDYGSTVIYVGTGGLEKPGGHGAHVSDQTFENQMNKSLLTSMHTQEPVRLVRGWQLRSKYAPENGYRYDGLYTVKSADMKKGRSGFQVCVFELERVPGQPPLPPSPYLTSSSSNVAQDLGSEPSHSERPSRVVRVVRRFKDINLSGDPASSSSLAAKASSSSIMMSDYAADAWTQRKRPRLAQQRSRFSDLEETKGHTGDSRTARRALIGLRWKRRPASALTTDALHLESSSLAVQSKASPPAYRERPVPSTGRPAAHLSTASTRGSSEQPSRLPLSPPEAQTRTARIMSFDAPAAAHRRTSAPSRSSQCVMDVADACDMLHEPIQGAVQLERPESDLAPSTGARCHAHAKSLRRAFPDQSSSSPIPPPMQEPQSPSSVSLIAQSRTAPGSHSDAVESPGEDLRTRSESEKPALVAKPSTVATDSDVPGVAAGQGCGLPDDPILVEEYRPRVYNASDDIIDLTVDD